MTPPPLEQERGNTSIGTLRSTENLHCSVRNQQICRGRRYGCWFAMYASQSKILIFSSLLLLFLPSFPLPLSSSLLPPLFFLSSPPPSLVQVLALSVREALEQTLATLHSGTATTGMDIGLQGGHSTDGETRHTGFTRLCKAWV